MSFSHSFGSQIYKNRYGKNYSNTAASPLTYDCKNLALINWRLKFAISISSSSVLEEKIIKSINITNNERVLSKL
jgi:hypothetical protein